MRKLLELSERLTTARQYLEAIEKEFAAELKAFSKRTLGSMALDLDDYVVKRVKTYSSLDMAKTKQAKAHTGKAAVMQKKKKTGTAVITQKKVSAKPEKKPVGKPKTKASVIDLMERHAKKVLKTVEKKKAEMKDKGGKEGIEDLENSIYSELVKKKGGLVSASGMAKVLGKPYGLTRTIMENMAAQKKITVNSSASGSMYSVTEN